MPKIVPHYCKKSKMSWTCRSMSNDVSMLNILRKLCKTVKNHKQCKKSRKTLLIGWVNVDVSESLLFWLILGLCRVPTILWEPVRIALCISSLNWFFVFQFTLFLITGFVFVLKMIHYFVWSFTLWVGIPCRERQHSRGVAWSEDALLVKHV